MSIDLRTIAASGDLKVGLDATQAVVLALVYLTYLLVIFLLWRDVVRTRREVSEPISLAWNFFVLFFPVGTVAWILHRRRLVARHRQSQSA